MADVLRRRKKAASAAVLLLLTTSGCAVQPDKVTLVDPKTEKSVTCPEGLYGSRAMTGEQAARQVEWHTEFQKTHSRLPTPMEGCLKLYEILGYVRKP